MQPNIIQMDRLCIAGKIGDGSKTHDIWNAFDRQYNQKPFPKTNGNGYEIRFWKSRVSAKTPDPQKTVHVGFAVDSAADAEGFDIITLPAAGYAVFDVCVAKGYDSENEAMEKWLADHAAEYRMLEFDGFEYVVECYNEKFKGGNQPDSVVEIWMPVVKI